MCYKVRGEENARHFFDVVFCGGPKYRIKPRSAERSEYSGIYKRGKSTWLKVRRRAAPTLFAQNFSVDTYYVFLQQRRIIGNKFIVEWSIMQFARLGYFEATGLTSLEQREIYNRSKPKVYEISISRQVRKISSQPNARHRRFDLVEEYKKLKLLTDVSKSRSEKNKKHSALCQPRQAIDVF